MPDSLHQPIAEKLAKMLALHCVRNTSLEDLHAGIFPSSKTGDYTDVKVVSPGGVPVWLVTLHTPHEYQGVPDAYQLN